MIAAFDTQTLIYATKPPHPVRNDDELSMKCARARMLLYMLEQAKAQILLPTVVIAEYIVPMNDEQRTSFLAQLQQSFMCPAFDLPAASIAASLHSVGKSVQRETGYNRHVLKADLMIIASAKAAGASILYSHDSRFRKIAANVIRCEDLPKSSGDMHIDNDIRRGEL